MSLASASGFSVARVRLVVEPARRQPIIQITGSIALGANGGGGILNVLSALSWFSFDGANTNANGYAAAKAAEWSLTNGIRLELAKQATLVTGLHLGMADTDLTASYDGTSYASPWTASRPIGSKSSPTSGARTSRRPWPTTRAPSTTPPGSPSPQRSSLPSDSGVADYSF
ncbi:hypothetical protein [Micromonospora sp. NPDC005203]|uniref:hypothetical protein n=1 Tax=Micromonospora sp. NPDC005203 TaxID=3364226 RepID=UPI0036CE7442